MTTLATKSTEKLVLRPHPHLYEINTWPWLEHLSLRLGRFIKLGDVPDSEWDSFAKLGFDVVWLMGVWQRSKESQRIALNDPLNHPFYEKALPGWTPNDVIGSPYSVVQYVPDPRMGTWEDLDRAREKLRERGIQLFLDFVGNHTALDHPWTREHPEFYVQGTKEDFESDPSSFYRVETAAGTNFLALGRDPYFPPWKDTLQLNHFQPQMRAAQIADLRVIASRCDGIRCDMAMLHLNDIFGRIWGRFLKNAKPPEKEFWTDAHAVVPGLILLAEAYWGTEQRLLDLGFSFAYDKGLYDAVRDANLPAVQNILSAPMEYQSRLARFLENHDEGPYAVVFGGERLPSVGTLMASLPGMRFYYQREFESFEAQLPITLRIGAEQPPDPVATEFFEKILRITNDPAFHQGQWSLLSITSEVDATSGNLIAYEWRSEKAWKMIVVNLTGIPSQGRVHSARATLPVEDLTFHDALNGPSYRRNGAELRSLGLFVRLDAFQAHLFEITPA